MTKAVQVLLSTYNGEKYVKEQLDSILRQDYPNISILIRDDGSTDRTVSILQEYADKYNQISYYEGKNLGVVGSFFDLIKNADISADYFSFSDQDDVWLNKKISRAVMKLIDMDQDIPLLYCGKTTVVDENLLPIHSYVKDHRITPNFGNAIVENICTGCTCVINRKELQLVQEHIPKYTLIHDWWLYLTASCFGKVYYDQEAYILYRQHHNNVVGMKSNYYEELKKRIRSFKGNRGKISNQAKIFQDTYHSDEQNQQLLLYVIEAKHNFQYRFIVLFSKKIYRQRMIDNFIFKILFLSGNV